MAKIVLYRGDTTRIDRFDSSKSHFLSYLGSGIYLTSDQGIADEYTVPRTYSNVLGSGNSRGEAVGDVLYRLVKKDEVFRTEIKELNHNVFGFNTQEEVRTEHKKIKSAALARAKVEAKKYFKKAKVRQVENTWYVYIPEAPEVSSFEFDSSYLDRCLDIDAPLTDEIIKALPIDPSLKAFRLLDNNGDEIFVNFNDYVEGFKTTNARYAWSNRIIGGKGERPSLDVIVHGTHINLSMDAVRKILEPRGYVGFKMIGGIKTNGSGNRGGGSIEHRVYCLWDDDAVADARTSSQPSVTGEYADPKDLGSYRSNHHYLFPRVDESLSADEPWLRDIRKPRENINTVANSNFDYYSIEGAMMVPVSDLQTSMVDSKDDWDRVKALVASLRGPDGYIEQIIVDQDYRVIEGQHRAMALKELGASVAPAIMIKDLSSGFPTQKVKDAINAAGSIHSDHVHQIVNMLAEIYQDEQGDLDEIGQYTAPKGFEQFWNAAVAALS